MSDLLAAAAKALNAPEVIVRRSAEARAKATGVSVDEVLAAWSGGGALAASTSPPPSSPAPAPQPAVTSVAPTAAPTPASSQPLAAAEVTTAPVEAVAAALGPPPPPATVTPIEALRYPVVISVPTAGISERTVPKLPRWLAATFFLLPIFGLLYLAGSASAECGEGSLLRVDRITGIAVNCDGSEFTGRGAPGGQVDFLALGERVFGGQEISIVNCSACHGPQGQGGVGPAFAAVVTTFSSCLDHVEWVAKGTAGFQGEGRATYGDIEKPVGGVGTMPGFGASLTSEQLASVVAFERIRFGGGAEDTVLQDCGLVTPDEPTEGESPTATTEGEAPATTTEGEASTSTPVVP